MKDKKSEMFKILLGSMNNDSYWGHLDWAKNRFFKDLGDLEIAIATMKTMWGIEIEWQIKPVERVRGRGYGVGIVDKIDKKILDNIN